MAEQVAIVHARATTEPTHCIAELGVDERVDDDGRTPTRAPHRDLELVDGLDARMPHLLELLLGKLRLERVHEPCRSLAGRVRDDVELDRRLRRHGPILAEATR